MQAVIPMLWISAAHGWFGLQAGADPGAPGIVEQPAAELFIQLYTGHASRFGMAAIAIQIGNRAADAGRDAAGGTAGTAANRRRVVLGRCHVKIVCLLLQTRVSIGFFMNVLVLVQACPLQWSLLRTFSDFARPFPLQARSGVHGVFLFSGASRAQFS